MTSALAVEQVDVAIVGTGVMGLNVAKRLVEAGISSFVLLDKNSDIGGVWNCNESWANASSRVQIIEPKYRLDDKMQMTDFTPQPELHAEMKRVCTEYGFAEKLRMGYEVTQLEDYPSVPSSRAICSNGKIIEARRAILLCTGGLQVPRRVSFRGEENFTGDNIMGVNGQIDKVDLKNKNVVIIGMGAFAVENARTSLLAGASHVTIVARNLNLVLPRLLLYLSSYAEGNISTMKDKVKIRLLHKNHKRKRETRRVAASKQQWRQSFFGSIFLRMGYSLALPTCTPTRNLC